MNKITRLSLTAISAFTIAVTFFPVSVTASTLSGETAYINTCQSCHGVNAEGNVLQQAPRLAGQHKSYLIRQLIGFRDGLRGYDSLDQHGQTMVAETRGLSDDQFEQIVSYISTLKAKTPVKTLTGGDPARGQEDYLGICITCHGSLGQGVASVSYLKGPAARLAGQHDWYLLNQLNKFKLKQRGTHKNDKYGLTMRTVLLELNKEQEFLDIIAYIQTLEN